MAISVTFFPFIVRTPLGSTYDIARTMMLKGVQQFERGIRRRETMTVQKDAIISKDCLYRYSLGRTWDASKERVLFIMLNPSTADAIKDDATIKKCVGFAQRWGYGGITVGNLFALRSRDPNGLLGPHDPVGPKNNASPGATGRRMSRSRCRLGELGQKAGTAPSVPRAAVIHERATAGPDAKPGRKQRRNAETSGSARVQNSTRALRRLGVWTSTHRPSRRFWAVLQAQPASPNQPRRRSHAPSRAEAWGTGCGPPYRPPEPRRLGRPG